MKKFKLFIMMIISLGLMIGCSSKDSFDDSKNENAKVNIEKSYDIDDANIQKIVEELKAAGKTPIVINDDGNLLLCISTDTNIKDVRLYKLGEDFSDFDFSIEKYLSVNKDVNFKQLTKSLSKDELLIVKVNEAEGIPTDCITWMDPSNDTTYYLITYDGKGEN